MADSRDFKNYDLEKEILINKNELIKLGFIDDDPYLHLEVNKDISFVSYANLPITSYMDDPPLASVEQFPYQQAEKATGILLQLIQSKGGDESIPHKVVLESKVMVNKGD